MSNGDLVALFQGMHGLSPAVLRQGLGSTLHVAAVFLGQAMQYGHIFLWAPYGQHVGQEYVDPGCGRGENYTNWDWCAAGTGCMPSVNPLLCCHQSYLEYPA